jgi:hypothetical protein
MEELNMAGTSEGGRKAARTRGRLSLSEAGRKGGKSTQRKALLQQQAKQHQHKEEQPFKDNGE